MAGRWNDRIVTVVLAWVAGYVDTAGFLGLNGLFTAHVTGNLVVAGAEVVGTGDDQVWVRLAVVPIFAIAVGSTAAFAQVRQCQPSSLLWLETLALLLFLSVGVVMIPDVNRPLSTNTLFWVGSTGVFAMGVQNALMRVSLGTFAPTTVMTGNFTQLVIDIFQFVSKRYSLKSSVQTNRRELQTRIGKFGRALIGFVVGAAAGALAMHMIGFWSIALPTIAIALLAINFQQRQAIS